MLCLASPFHPGTSFRASNAMARNKIVYCLSTLAIVVATGYSKGGTWTGAVEALKAKWVPVFVRVGDLAPPANQKLMEIGARPLVEERVGYGESLLDWLRLVAAGTSDSDPTPSSAIDLFTLAWPSIAAFLTTPRSEDDISRRFDLVPSQVSHWLLRAEAKGEANRTLNGWVVDSTDKDVWQESLFSDG
jgi:predicted Rossmann fold nucleotide-binding protein DprA/Smf involved in DNA uptake